MICQNRRAPQPAQPTLALSLAMQDPRMQAEGVVKTSTDKQQ